MVSEAIAKGDIQAINYFVAQKYVEALGQIASAGNQKVIMLPLEATSLLGSLGGIGEISRGLFGNAAAGGGAAGSDSRRAAGGGELDHDRRGLPAARARGTGGSWR